MGLLSLFTKASAPLVPLPRGSFTVDREGRILASTLPQAFPIGFVDDIATQVLAAFRSAQAVEAPLTEVIINYSCLKLIARELRGGAIVFLVPQTLSSSTN